MTRKAVKRFVGDLPPLVAPLHLRGRFSGWDSDDLRQERRAWAAMAGRNGYSSADVGAALGISRSAAYDLMRQGGWDAWAHLRVAS